MGMYERQHWTPQAIEGVPRAYRQRGQYWAYVPDRLPAQIDLPGDVVDRVADATAALVAAGRASGGAGLDSFASLTLRSEAVASSVIEGITASAKNVALADFTGHGSSAALEVARNARIMRHATREMAEAPAVTLADIVDLQAQLVPYLPGVRNEPVWIGGPNPLVAEFVAPPAARVPALLDDLVAYLNTPRDTVVVAAAVIHAQFETIHPFRDGNGRVGRALTHTVLARAHATPAVVPVSRVLAARKQTYIEGLGAWRTYDDNDQRLDWIVVFTDALREAAGLAVQMAARVNETQKRLHAALAAARTESGGRQPRRGSAVVRLLDSVVAHPVDTAATAARRLAISTVAARDALEELATVGVYRPVKIDKGKTISYVASEILALADELAYAGEPPKDDQAAVRIVATREERRQRDLHCGYPLRRTGAWCTEAPGHAGQHRRRR